MDTKTRSFIIEDSIPLFIRQEYPNFVEFIKVYYSQQDQEEEASHFISNVLAYHDVDSTTLEYLENFSGQYLTNFPSNTVDGLNKRTLIKNIRQFYDSLGSEKSIKFLFRIMFNEDVSIYYPTYDILRFSDGTWRDDYVIKISNNNNGDIADLVGTEVVGQTSGSRAIVEKVDLYVASNGFNVAELVLNDVSPINSFLNFQVDETVIGTSLDGLKTFEERVYSIITDVEVQTNDLYNAPGDIISIQSTNGVDGFIAVQLVQSGSIDSMEIIKAGTGYSEGNLITFESPTGRGAKAFISAVGGSGEIQEITMISSGYAFEDMPAYSINSSGTGAILYPVSTDIGKIRTVEISNLGVNYRTNESPGFPYKFPIEFTFAQTEITFYHTAFVYDDNWNGINYKSNENITGQTSGATGIIKKINQGTGIMAYELSSETEFIEGEEIIGEASGATGYKIHKKFHTEGIIIPGAIGNSTGYFYDTRGFISSDKYIQDSYYYQDFSYEISTSEERDNWIGPLNDLIHPAGSIVFGFSDQGAFVSSYTYGGWISPILNSVEHYKHNWTPHAGEDWNYTDYGNTQIKTFSDYKIYEIGYIVPDDYEEQYPFGMIGDEAINTLRKTNICFGSQIKASYADADQSLLIDGINALLIDSVNTLLT